MTEQPESDVIPILDGVPEETTEPLDAGVQHEATHEEVMGLLRDEEA